MIRFLDLHRVNERFRGEMEEAFRLYAVAMEEFREFERDMLAKIQSQQ